ncbi:MAG: universal stress protein [Victivallales bacterium]|nr:universal stress protein [Victivallales bacterium]
MQEQPIRVLYCTDFSENASRAFAYALDAAALRKGSELHLIHVIPEPDAQFWKSYIYDAEGDVDEKAKKDIDEKIDREYRPQIPEGLVFKTAFRIGKSHAEILKYADEIGARLIVVGRQGTGALTSLFFGSVAEKVVKKAHCPVLVIPPDK